MITGVGGSFGNGDGPGERISTVPTPVKALGRVDMGIQSGKEGPRLSLTYYLSDEPKCKAKSALHKGVLNERPLETTHREGRTWHRRAFGRRYFLRPERRSNDRTVPDQAVEPCAFRADHQSDGRGRSMRSHSSPSRRHSRRPIPLLRRKRVCTMFAT